LPHETDPSVLKHVNDAKIANGVRVPKCPFSDSLADSAFSRMKTEECRQKLENAVCEMDKIGWPVHLINNTCSKFS
jgi:predicted deacetylase